MTVLKGAFIGCCVDLEECRFVIILKGSMKQNLGDSYCRSLVVRKLAASGSIAGVYKAKPTFLVRSRH